MLGDTLYVLTYRENTVFTFDPETLEPKGTMSYSRQGWGLTTDGEYLIASDGTSKLYFMDESLNDVKTVTVTSGGKEVENLNELEYIDGCIWANVWLTNDVLIIDSDSGNVIKALDFTGLYTGEITDRNDVLNGIACSPDGRIYLTGKRWDTLFEFRLR